MARPETGPEYEGFSRGRFARVRKAAKDAERAVRADLEKRDQWPPASPLTYKAEIYVTIGNPIHEYRVVLRPHS